MANPKELQEAAAAIRDVRRLPAVQRHKELDGLLLLVVKDDSQQNCFVKMTTR
jgi:hypothetical protein